MNHGHAKSRFIWNDAFWLVVVGLLLLVVMTTRSHAFSSKAPKPEPTPSASPSPAASPTPSPSPLPSPSGGFLADGTQVASCEVLPGSEKTVQLGTIKLPAKGKFFQESHLVQPEDGFGSGWPKSGDQGITAHLKRSYEQIRKVGFTRMTQADVYAGHWAKVWTGSEGGGDIGNGARRIKPRLDAEPWVFNMYWTNASFPPAYTRYIICNEGKSRCVVAAGGIEVGPGLKRFAGAQTELVKYLDGDTFWIMGRAKAKGLQFGPIKCL